MIKSNKKLGFSLLELIITISIIGIMAAVVAVSMSSARSAAKIEAAQKELSSEIALAKACALQGKMQSGKTPCGYGIHFSDNVTYSIFYNYSAATDCETFNENSGASYYSHSGFSTDLDTKKLSNGVTATYSDIYFTLPNGRVYSAGGELASGSSMDFTVTLSGSNKKVTVNSSGLITTEE